jgi:hypothetical membrane protein
MSINFFGRGVTSGALVVAILDTGSRTRSRTVGTVLLAVAGLCSAVIAFFPTDIPPGAGISPTTVQGLVHVVGATTGFILALAAFWVLSFWAPGRTRAGGVSLLVASAGLVFLGISIVAVPDVLGLAERMCLLGILGWVFVAACKLRAAD